MDTKEIIIELLGSLIHPETGEDLVKSGFVEQVNASDEHISVALHFAKARDPFAFKLKAQAEALLREAFPAATVTVMLREGTPRKPQQQEHRTTTGAIRHVVAVASGKGASASRPSRPTSPWRCATWATASACSMPTSTDPRSPGCSASRATCPTPCRRTASTR